MNKYICKKEAAQRILSVLLLCLSSLAAWGQSFNQDPGNPNMDFSEGNFTDWKISWGDRGNTPYDNEGMPTNIPSHAVINIYGTNFEGMTGPGNLQRVPSGLTHVARLGAPTGGGYGFAKSYAMTYTFTVNSDYPILFFQVASVMDRTHDATNNTHFNYRLLDPSGNIVTQPCGGFRMYPKGGTCLASHTEHYNQSVFWSSAFPCVRLFTLSAVAVSSNRP